jgi:hypothetical protein
VILEVARSGSDALVEGRIHFKRHEPDVKLLELPESSSSILSQSQVAGSETVFVEEGAS